jgi:hypothetical protein
MGKRYETEKKIQGAPIGNKNAEKSSYQSDNFVSDPAKTNENLAKEYGENVSNESGTNQYVYSGGAQLENHQKQKNEVFKLNNLF